ncbi:MAG: signal peptidase I [Candidatus Zixiibacteriota bacterium]
MSDIYDSIWENVKSILIAVILAIIIKTSVVEAYKIPSASMEDTLLIGDFLIANKFIYGARIPIVNWQLPGFTDPKQGDVVIFKWPGDKQTNYIKRCVAAPGQTVELKDEKLYVDGVLYADSAFVKYDNIPGHNVRHSYGPYKVPQDYYFMMGDNRDNSSDSRYWGPVHKDLILGEALFIHWSWLPDNDSPEVAVADPLSVPRLFLYNIVHFPERVRWSRLFNIIE